MTPTAILTDIEGTTTPIAFVRDTLFPYARARLAGYLADHAQDQAVVAAMAETARLAPGQLSLAALLAWMDADAKVTPLKALQGLIWREGYESGALHGRLYSDVAPALRHWHARGLTLAVYSSGSEAAQRLLFRHSDSGDLSALFTHYFDTRIGGKRDQASYARIAAALGVPAGQILFLSDVAEELDAANAAGLQACQLVRAEDATCASPRHAQAANFSAVSDRYG